MNKAKRFIVIVLDSYGCGAMDDILPSRPKDIGANTFAHIFERCPELRLPVLQKLGLGCASDPGGRFLTCTPGASYGRCLLQHWGADTFLGHQELLGTNPKPPLIRPFSEDLPRIEELLKSMGHRVERYGAGLPILLVDNSFILGDNLETDPGQNINLTASFDAISYQEVSLIGRRLRKELSCNRLIVFGAPDIPIGQILAAYQENKPYAGVSAPASGVYKEGYQVLHLGFGVDAQEQAPWLLGESGIPSVLIGKVADIAENHPIGQSFGELVDTEEIMNTALGEILRYSEGFFCINIQETDLAGHAEDAPRYARVLETADRKIGELILLLEDGDLLVITADHGNDPTIGHSRHTRERVPLLVYAHGLKPSFLGERATLSDIAASACAFFDIGRHPPNGTSFLNLLSFSKL